MPILILVSRQSGYEFEGARGRPGCEANPLCGNHDVAASYCGGREPGVAEPVVPNSNSADPMSSLNFYKFLLVAHLIGRSDTKVNCFTADFVPDREARCKAEAAANHRPATSSGPWRHLNLDNDVVDRKRPPLVRPCNIPAQLRRQLSGLANLTASVIGAMEEDGSKDLLGNKDMDFLGGLLSRADEKLGILKSQFEDCPVGPAG